MSSKKELTEEGLPFLILFHHPDDNETPEKFKKQVILQLLQERSEFLLNYFTFYCVLLPFICNYFTQATEGVY